MKRLPTLMLITLVFLAFAGAASAQQKQSAANPLVRLLQSKGIITDQEAAMASEASSPAEAEQRLARLLLSKGIITREEYDETAGPSTPRAASAMAHLGGVPGPEGLNNGRQASDGGGAGGLDSLPAQRRALAAERLVRDADVAAKAAQNQASRAMEAARRAREVLLQLDEPLARAAEAGEAPAEQIARDVPGDDHLAGGEGSVGATANAASAAQPQAEGPMTTLSKIPVKIYGNILFSSNFVDRGANTNDIPLFAQKRGTSADQNHQNVNMTLRQTRFGLRYEGKIFKDAKLTGVFEFDLLGGKPAFANGVNFDIFRLRLAYGRIDWANDSLEVGQDWAVFSPLNPTTLASYAIPGFSTSGNLWERIPQIRYEHRADIRQKSKFIFTTALLDPDAGDSAGNPAARVIGLGERGSLPAFETRLGFTVPSHGKESSAGVSGHYSRLLGVPGNPAGTLVRSPIDSYGVSGDVNVWLSSGFRVTGEIFHGRALGIFSGDIAQSSVVIGGRALGINSTGGWAELHGEAPAGYEGSWKKFSANFGYGIEDNSDKDLVVGIRKRNQTYMINGQYKFSPNFTFALEYRQVLTDWFGQPFANQKLNWANLSFMYSF